jgi:penicillin-binding protein 1B
LKKKNVIKHIIKIISFFIVLGAMFVGGYSYVAVQEFKLKLSETMISESQIHQKSSTLEAGTQINTNELFEYILYSKVKKTNRYLELISKQKRIKRRNKTEILENIMLPDLNINSCSKFRCVQVRQKFSDIPGPIWKALLGTEDFRFLEHRGVDLLSIGRAIIVDVIAMKFIQGGSTLTQQLVKNLFLTNERKLSRKIKEMVYALYIENILSKDQIINLYLNEVFWGTYQGIYIKGFYAASLAYFEKKPNELSEYEATMLVSLLKGPNYYRPKKEHKRIKSRSNAVFKRLQGLRLVSSTNRNIWDDTTWDLWANSFKSRNLEFGFNSYYLLTKNREGKLEGYEKFVFYNAVKSRQKTLAPRLKNADIGIKVIIANSTCNNFDCENLFSYYSKEQRDRRVAITEEYHQVGSLLKPIVYDTFIELGRTYDEQISTNPLTLKLKSGKWTPKDYSKADTESISLKVALQKSKNIPLIRVASEIGFDKVEELLVDKIPHIKLPLSEYPSQLLGAIELSMQEVMSSYSKFIKQKCEKLKLKEESFEKSILKYMSVSNETTISKLARGPLKDALVFGKTGTSNNGLDNWYFAFDGENIYVIWFGVESNRNSEKLNITGASTAYLILQSFLNNRGKHISEVHCEAKFN